MNYLWVNETHRIRSIEMCLDAGNSVYHKKGAKIGCRHLAHNRQTKRIEYGTKTKPIMNH